MDARTKRIALLTIKNLCKTMCYSIIGGLYFAFCLWLSYYYTRDTWFGLIGLFIPMIIYTVWDYSKGQIEDEMENEERTMKALSRKYE